MTEIGDVIQTDTNDLTLKLLNQAENILGGAVDKANELMDTLYINQTIELVGSATMFTNVALETLGQGLSGIDSVMIVAGEIKEIFAGKKNPVNQTVKKF
jgi:hypothetical protein